MRLTRRPLIRLTTTSSGDVDQQRRGQPALDAPRARCRKRVGLIDRAREAVEQEAVARVVIGEALEDHADDHAVGHEFAGVHVALGLGSERCRRGDGGAEHVPGRDVRQAEVLGQPLSLRAFARARRSEQDEV